jgi:hypothetical protein
VATGAPVPGAGRRGGAVSAADRLRAEVAAAVAAALAGASGPTGRIHVGWVAALDASGCPARFRASGEGGWGFPGWSPALAAGAVGRAALDWHLTETDVLGDRRSPPLPEPLEVVRRWVRTAPGGSGDGGGVGGWVAGLRADGDMGGLAALAAGASRWLAGFVRVFGWPLPSDLGLLNVPGAGGSRTWRPPGGDDVSVGSGADARLGRITGVGRFALVVHRPSGGHDGGVRDRAAFEAASGALGWGIVPEAVLVTAGDSGERVRVPVDGDLLAAGGRMVVEVVRQRVRALDVGHDPADATPSPACRWCDHLDTCPPGREWLAGPGRWRGGLPRVFYAETVAPATVSA